MDAGLAEVIAAGLAETKTPGCAVAMAHGGRTWASGFGLANVETEVAFTPRTRIPIGSMTKPYTATLLLALVEAGRLDLDARVRRYLPEFRVADPAASDATVRQLLNHTAGWVGELGEADGEDPHDLDRGSSALAAQVTRMDAFRQVTPPGAQWSYSNSAYVVAGRIAEALCDQPYETLLERVVFEPLGMSSSTAFPERAMTHPLAVGHVAAANGFEVVHLPWTPARRLMPAGGIASTATDQLRWHRWWLGDGQDGGAAGPLSALTRDRMISETVPAGTGCDAMGLGWMIDELDGGTVVHHGGTWSGFQTMGLFVPAADLALVLLANSRGGVRLGYTVRAYVLDRWAGLREPERPPIDVEPGQLAEYEGSYRSLHATDPARDTFLTVSVSDNGLTLDVPGQDRGDSALVLQTSLFHEDEAVMLDGPLQGLRVEFLRDADSRVGALRFGGRIWRRDPDEGA